MSLESTDSKIRALKITLHDMKYAGRWDEAGLKAGDPAMTLIIMHFLLFCYSPRFALWLSEKGYALQTLPDLSFVEQTFHMLQVEFNYKSPLTPSKFFTTKFASAKLDICRDIAKFVKKCKS